MYTMALQLGAARIAEKLSFERDNLKWVSDLI